MPSNIEVKAHVTDPERFRQVAAEICDSRAVLRQEDTFFAVNRGRLKLRMLPDNVGELIFYERPDTAGPKESIYTITKTGDPDGLRSALSDALGVIGVVRKKRELFLVGETRVHLDSVEDLGVFAELEVVRGGELTVGSAAAIADRLMGVLGIREVDLIESAYIDLLAGRAS